MSYTRVIWNDVQRKNLYFHSFYQTNFFVYVLFCIKVINYISYTTMLTFFCKILQINETWWSKSFTSQVILLTYKFKNKSQEITLGALHCTLIKLQLDVKVLKSNVKSCLAFICYLSNIQMNLSTEMNHNPTGDQTNLNHPIPH